MLELKSLNEIEIMHESGRRLSSVMKKISRMIEAGLSTIEIDRFCESEITKQKGIPSFKNYRGFPASACVSINQVVVHGIPSKAKLCDGDIVGIDIGMCYNGYHSDMARTFAIGSAREQDLDLIRAARESFYDCLKFAKIGNRIGDISNCIQENAESKGYSVVRELSGHGIGKKLHEAPNVPNFGRSGHGIRIENGLCIAIEPMINAGKKEVVLLDDGWTVETKDGSNSAHYENTIAILEDGPIVLTDGEV